MKRFILLMLCVSPAGAVLSQQPPANPNHDAEKVVSSVDVPKVKLEFGEPKLVAGVTGSPLIGNQKQCGPDGAVFVQMAVAPLYRERQVVTLGGQSGGQTYSLSLVPNNLHDISLVDYSPTSSEVAFLVRATEKSEQSEYRSTTPNGKVESGKGYLGDHHNYIVVYDRKGNYKSTIELAADMEFTKFAELETGEFVLLGYNPANRVADLQLVASTGKWIKSIEIPSRLASDPSLLQGETGDEVELSKALHALTRWQFTSSRGKVVLFRPGSAGSVLEIGPGGVSREVPLESPAGFELDGFVSANDRWLVRYRRKGLPEHGPVDTNNSSGNFALFEVNALDGSLRTELELTSRSPVFGVSCEADGEVMLVAIDDKLNFRVSKADIPR